MSVEKEGDNIPFLCGVETPLEIHHDWHSSESLGTTIIQTMMENAEVDSTAIPVSLYESVDPDALEDLFQPRQEGVPRMNGETTFAFAGHYITVQGDGKITIESELGRLKRTGGNVLLAGDVPEDMLDQISVQLLGDLTRDRTLLFSQYGKSPETARTQLALSGNPNESATIVVHEAGARSTMQVQASGSKQINEIIVADTFEEFNTKIQDQMSQLQHQQNGFEPAELRFCFDSLRLLLEEKNTETVDRFITTITQTIRDVQGLGHYIYPGKLHSQPLQTFQSKFDVTIELKIEADGVKQRLHLHDTDHTTRWFPL